MPGDGFLNMLKPPGMTSHDIVVWARARLGVRRIGHLGTLDPAAAGVLPLSIGRCTRLFQFAGGPEKAYRAEIVFGVETDTLDSEGGIVGEQDARALDRRRLEQLLRRFLGEMEQTPPAFSAARVDGQRLHRRARAGHPAQARPKRVRVTSLEFVDFMPGRRARALLDIVCSTGTYVRSLARDLGRAAGCGASLGFLVRTRAGRFALEECSTMEEIEAGDAEASVLAPDWPLAHLSALALDEHEALSFVQGTQVYAGEEPVWPVRVYGPGPMFLGLGEVAGRRRLRPRLVLATQEELHRAGAPRPR